MPIPNSLSFIIFQRQSEQRSLHKQAETPGSQPKAAPGPTFPPVSWEEQAKADCKRTPEPAVDRAQDEHTCRYLIRPFPLVSVRVAVQFFLPAKQNTLAAMTNNTTALSGFRVCGNPCRAGLFRLFSSFFCRGILCFGLCL